MDLGSGFMAVLNLRDSGPIAFLGLHFLLLKRQPPPLKPKVFLLSPDVSLALESGSPETHWRLTSWGTF